MQRLAKRKFGRAVLVAASCLAVLTVGCAPPKARSATGPAAGGVSVKTFGARGDGVSDDSAAFQAAVDSVPATGGTILVPAGTYRIGAEIVVRRSHLKLRGDGPQSVLKLRDGVTNNIFVMPAPFLTNTHDILVSDIEMSGLTLDGNKNGNPATPPTFFAIQMLHAEHVLLSELTLRDWPYDAISIGVGEAPNVDVTIRNSHFSGIGRNGIHLGYGSNLRVSQVYVEDTPSQQWGPAAGNGVDVEVEGVNSFVDGVVVEDSIFERMDTRTAGDGIALQPAYGPVRNGVVQGNVIRNHQTGVFVASAQGVTVAKNWVVSDSNKATGAGISVLDSSPTVEGNVVNMLRWLSDFAHAGVFINGAASPEKVTGNRVWGGLCTVRTTGGAGSVTLDDNEWGNDSGCFLDPSSPGARVAESANTRVPVASLDKAPPVVGFQLQDGAALKKQTAVRLSASDEGEGVARVFFLVDGIPTGFADKAPYEFTVDPSHYTAGSHTLAAIAVDKAANVSTTAEVRVTLGR